MTKPLTPEEVADYAMGTLQEWFDGYFGEGPQYRASLADYGEGWSEFTIMPVDRNGPDPRAEQRFRVRVVVEELPR